MARRVQQLNEQLLNAPRPTPTPPQQQLGSPGSTPTAQRNSSSTSPAEQAARVHIHAGSRRDALFLLAGAACGSLNLRRRLAPRWPAAQAVGGKGRCGRQ